MVASDGLEKARVRSPGTNGLMSPPNDTKLINYL